MESVLRSLSYLIEEFIGSSPCSDWAFPSFLFAVSGYPPVNLHLG